MHAPGRAPQLPGSIGDFGRRNFEFFDFTCPIKDDRNGRRNSSAKTNSDSCHNQQAPYALCMDYREIITIEAAKRSGKPCIRGTRMTVSDVLEYLASGMTHQEILDEFPDLNEEDIRACLAFAADRERKLATLPE
jgi:uncharacterized protein (DUF433 family)